MDHGLFRESRSLLPPDPLENLAQIDLNSIRRTLVLSSCVLREGNWVGALIWIARTSYAGRYCNENWIGLGAGGAIVGWFACTNARYSNDLSAILRAGGLNGLGGLTETGNSTSRLVEHRPTFTPRDS